MEFSADNFMTSSGAQMMAEGVKRPACGIATDTRTLKKGELFFALQGPHFDGHAFCEQAIEKGAWGVVVSRTRVPEYQSTGVSPPWIFQVKDTLQALGDLAGWWRRQMPAQCVAITGSNGKTTTKEMLASMVATRLSTLKTEGNFNNLIGLPLTLSRLEKKHEVAILEMGMNAPGEIARLTQIAAPQVGIITNAAAAHLEKLHTVEEVAKAKAELFAAMDAQGTAVFNVEDPCIRPLGEKFPGKKISFGMRKEALIRFEHMEQEDLSGMELKFSIGKERLKARLCVAGLHNVMNALAAAGGAFALGLSPAEIEKGLENFKPLKMRFEQVQLGNGVRLVNDAYNANPLSMEAAFRTVGAGRRSGRFIAVLGDMKELGEQSQTLHAQVGQKGVEAGIDRFFLIGEFAPHFAQGILAAGLPQDNVRIFDQVDSLVAALEKEMKAGDVVLVKASRAMQLERIVDALKYKFGA